MIVPHHRGFVSVTFPIQYFQFLFYFIFASVCCCYYFRKQNGWYVCCIFHLVLLHWSRASYGKFVLNCHSIIFGIFVWFWHFSEIIYSDFDRNVAIKMWYALWLFGHIWSLKLPRNEAKWLEVREEKGEWEREREELNYFFRIVWNVSIVCFTEKNRFTVISFFTFFCVCHSFLCSHVCHMYIL